MNAHMYHHLNIWISISEFKTTLSLKIILCLQNLNRICLSIDHWEITGNFSEVKKNVWKPEISVFHLSGYQKYTCQREVRVKIISITSSVSFSLSYLSVSLTFSLSPSLCFYLSFCRSWSLRFLLCSETNYVCEFGEVSASFGKFYLRPGFCPPWFLVFFSPVVLFTLLWYVVHNASESSSHLSFWSTLPIRDYIIS